MKKALMIGSAGLAVALLLTVTALMLPGDVQAGRNIVAVEGVSFNANAALADNLNALKGKKVQVSLESGESFTGLIKEVGTQLIHVEKLEGKEFFDALIKVKDISAISTRFRQIKR